jgi:hypothetical protein
MGNFVGCFAVTLFGVSMAYFVGTSFGVYLEDSIARVALAFRQING